jgi:transposase InsO family protein
LRPTGIARCEKTLLRAGETVPRCQVQRLMRQNGIQGAKRRGKPWRTTISDPDALPRRDLVCRDFSADALDLLWVGDFERHEALLNRVVMKGHHHQPVAAGWLKLRAA